MKLTILWSNLADYTAAFFRSLALDQGVTIQLVFMPANESAPYEGFDLGFCFESLEYSSMRFDEIAKRIRLFAPEIVLMVSWNYTSYMRLCGELRKGGVYVVSATDNQLRHTLKQIGGMLISRWYLKPCIDNFLVPGDRQARFMKMLGYPEPLEGHYAANIERFREMPPILDRPKAFLFLGRLVGVKGINALIKGFEYYCSQTVDPWRMVIGGVGPLKDLIDTNPMIDYIGFVQPFGLADFMKMGRCFILPSLFEPWGVVIHEAAAAGLPIICSNECGACAQFVRDGLNGYIIEPRPGSLKSAMERISHLPPADLEGMSEVSGTLGGMWSPKQLAKYFVDAMRHRVQNMSPDSRRRQKQVPFGAGGDRG